MSTIKVTDLNKDVVTLIGVGYEHIYNKIQKVLSTDEITFFAAPIRNANSVEWSTDMAGSRIRYEELDEAAKSRLAAEIEDIKEGLEKKLSQNAETKDFVKAVFTIPSRDSIVFFKTAEGVIKPVMTEWGFRSTDGNAGLDHFRHFIDRPKAIRVPVTLAITFHNEKYPPNRLVHIKIDDVASTHTMDESGMIALGKINIGSPLAVFNPTASGPDSQSAVVGETQEVYPFQFAYKTGGQILVVDQNDTPQASTHIVIQNEARQEHLETDKSGMVFLTDIVADTALSVSLAQDSTVSSVFTIVDDAASNQFKFVIKTPEYQDIRIVVIDQQNVPVPGYPVGVTQSDLTGDYVSNNDGIIYLQKVPVDQQISLTDLNNPANTLTFRNEKGRDEYHFRIQREIPASITLQLLDHKNKPLPQVPLDVRWGFSQFSETTDDEGRVFFTSQGITNGDKGMVSVHVKDDKDRVRTHHKKLSYAAGKDLYIVKLTRFDKRWLLLLLLLLPFLMLIQQSKEIWIQTIDSKTEKMIPNIPVKLEYVRYSLYDKGEFFRKDAIERVVVSDSTGVARFDSINYTWYSLFVRTFTKASVSSHTDCYGPDIMEKAFHGMWNKRIVEFPLNAIILPLEFFVVDAENNYPVANAGVYIQYSTLHETILDSARTDASGRVSFDNVPQCSMLDELYATAYAYYKDSLLGGVSLDLISGGPLRRTFKLKPVKESIEFYVTDCRSNQPMPDAEATIYFDDEAQGTETVMTNVNGIGRGIYKDVHIRKKVKIVVTKPFYKAAEHDRGYTVDEFKNLNRVERTICLEPEKLSLDFYNIDESNGNPITGVKNTITLVDGKDTTSFNATSNSNGVFQVPGIVAGSTISIVSVLDPYYHKNEDKVKNVPVDNIFREITNSDIRTIPLKPKTFTLQFRTLDAEDGTILPDVGLNIRIDGKEYTAVKNSNNGQFEVEATYSSKISITANKDGFETNDTKINNRMFSELSQAAPGVRDIPLQLPKCNFIPFKDPQHTNSLKEWNMGQKGGEFLFSYYTDEEPDLIQVYAGRKKDIDNATPLFEYYGATKRDIWLSKKIQFSGTSFITVKITGSTKWEYAIRCPD